MNLLELFAGSRSVGNEADKQGLNVFSVDWEKYDKIDLSIDIGELRKEDIPFVPNIVWASPDCTTYSIAACSTHRTNTKEPKSDYAIKCDIVNQHWIGLIKEWLEINPNLVFFIENPRGMLRHMEWMQEFKRHTVWYCFSGDTKYITKEGLKDFKSTVNSKQYVLVKNKQWVLSDIKKFGKKQIVELIVRRGGVKKVISTTDNHIWFSKKRHQKNYTEKTTSQLTINERLQYNAIELDNFMIDSEYFCRGFVVGDGYKVEPKEKIRKKGHSVSMVYGNKNNGKINTFFDLYGHNSFSTIKNGIDCRITSGLPYDWKDKMPDLSLSKDKLISWLSGYFAADGTVGVKNSQCNLSSANKSNLLFVRDLCNIVGIGTYTIGESMRKGFNKDKSSIYNITLMRETLPINFFVNEKHIKNFKKIIGYQSKDWIVDEVIFTDRIENVYCAVVPNDENFTLEDNILTHNCQYGDDRAKPTDIWTNSKTWVPRPMCRNYKYDSEGNIIDRHCHHESARRGAKTGTQGKKGSFERSKIPQELCQEIIESTKIL